MNYLQTVYLTGQNDRRTQILSGQIVILAGHILSPEIKRNRLNYYGLCYVVSQKWINILKGSVSVGLEKSSDKDKMHVPLNQLSCKLATKG